MKYSLLALLVQALVKAFGPVPADETTDFQEDCAGEGYLTVGVRTHGLKARKRDASWRKLRSRYQHSVDS